MGEKNSTIYKVTIISIFSALTFVGTMIHIPMPFGGMIHLGNFVCILTALLCGGFIGGVSGSLGMGLYDIFNYGSSTFIRTIIIKFLVGFFVGLIFKIIIKKEYKITKGLIYISCFFIIIFIGSLLIYILNDKAFFFNNKEIKISLLIPISSGLISILLIFINIFSSKKNYFRKAALLSCCIGVIINIVGEFFLRIPLVMLFDDLSYNMALIKSISSLPSSILTGILTAIFITIISYPLYLSVQNINFFNFKNR